LHRSGNALKSLSIRCGFAFDARPQVLHCFPNMIWERLEELHIQCGVNTGGLQEVLPDGTLNRLRLQKLSITTGCGPRPRKTFVHSRVFHSLLEHSCSQPLQSLVFNGPAIFPWKSVEACTTLRELVIATSDISSKNLFPILSQNSSLKILDLIDFKPPPPLTPLCCACAFGIRQVTFQILERIER